MTYDGQKHLRLMVMPPLLYPHGLKKPASFQTNILMNLENIKIVIQFKEVQDYLKIGKILMIG